VRLENEGEKQSRLPYPKSTRGEREKNNNNRKLKVSPQETQRGVHFRFGGRSLSNPASRKKSSNNCRGKKEKKNRSNKHGNRERRR
jgi:hypothetical protein